MTRRDERKPWTVAQYMHSATRCLDTRSHVRTQRRPTQVSVGLKKGRLISGMGHAGCYLNHLEYLTERCYDIFIDYQLPPRL